MITRLPSKDFWNGKKVLITGHSGFKGSWLSIWLNKLGASVTGVSLEPSTTPNLFNEANIKTMCDSSFLNICKLKEITSKIKSAQPEILIHMAAQPLVRKSYEEPINTFEVNILGTANILEAMRSTNSIRTAIMITTDKVYKNNEDGRSYAEDDQLGGHDPYSSSKAGAEIIINSYRSSFLEDKISISSARAGNVIGGGDWSPDRLIPDAVKAWQANIDLNIRNPAAVRPWQHVLEPLSGYLLLAEDTFNESKLTGAYNFGPNKQGAASVKSVIRITKEILNISNINFMSESQGPHEANLLFLDINKATSLLNFQPKWNLQESVEKTVNWYKAYYDGVNALSLCESDIDAYEAPLK